ncbi:hypothetical protein HMPREF3232_00726 [Fannyhessea vaginae]|nr:hypothetical protein HMPREF3232_00726 [Fannyhessea vaginae]
MNGWVWFYFFLIIFVDKNMTNGEQATEIVKRVAGKYAFVINAIMAIIPIRCINMNAIVTFT